MTAMPSAWGPDRRRAAVSITFDNLGEAADIEFGLWPADRPVGAHPTATTTVPALLERLGDVRATFYIEAINAGLYPDLIGRIAAAGHEVGVHGWRHELWDKVPADARSSVLGRCVDAFGGLGLRPVGFRPPGGVATDDLPALLVEHGFSYHSSVGDEASVEDGVVSLPFRWAEIDGVQLEAGMGGAAVAGEPPATALERMRHEFGRSLDAAVAGGGHLVLIFHPWIIGATEERMDAAIDIIRSVADRSDVWVAPAKDVAAFLVEGVVAYA